MGCDIHMYCEYELPRRPDQSPFWWNIGSRWNPGRNYTMFGYLAGVRDDEVEPVDWPRGVPEALGWRTSADYCVPVEEAGPGLQFVPRQERLGPFTPFFDQLEEQGYDELISQLLTAANFDDADAITRQQADNWVASGISTWVTGPHPKTDWGTVGYVSNPDWHSASWLTLDELSEAITRYEMDDREGEPLAYPFQYAAMRDLLAAYNEQGFNTRVVFWFDN